MPQQCAQGNQSWTSQHQTHFSAGHGQPEAAELARQHNDANVLALGERLIAVEIAKDSVKKFLSTEFEGGRHQRRVDKLSQIGKTTAN